MPQAATVLAALLASLALALAPASGAAATEWTVNTDESPRGRCRLESSRASMSDGYQQTTVYFSVTPRSVAIVSAAPLDGGFADLGFAVDDEPFVRMDRVEGGKMALFDSKHELVVAQFKAGNAVRVQLRFWPTWPATGTHEARLSLIGFTKGYGQLAGCR